MEQAHGKLSGSFSAYVTTHCTTCLAGWTRKGGNGRTTIVCLLDREPVWADMETCDRFEAKDDDPA